MMDISIPTKFLENILNISNIDIPGEYNRYFDYWPLFIFGLIFAFIAIPLVGKIALYFDVTYKPKIRRKNKDYDNPDKAIHELETPALGGLAITIPALIAMLFLFRLDGFTTPIILATLVLVIGSVLDDVLNLSSKIQLAYQLLAASIIAFSIIDLSYISFFTDDFLNLTSLTWNSQIFSIPLSFVFPGDLILIIWIFLCINAVKWVGGSPGLIESYSFIIFILLFIIGIRTFSIFSSTISIIIAGALLSLLYFAFPSPKIMSGSSGKSIYGFLISILALITGVKFSTTLMLLAIPIIDACYVVFYRYVTYKPKNILDLMRINDTSHLHHKLLKLNLSSKQILLLETGVSLFIGSLAILSTGALRYFVLIFGISSVIIFIVFINYKASKKEIEKDISPESKYSY